MATSTSPAEDNRNAARLSDDDVEHLRRVIMRGMAEIVDQRLQPYLRAYSEIPLNRDMLKNPTVTPANTDTEITELVVGGKVFVTTPTTLLKCRKSKLAKAYACLQRYHSGLYRIFVDRDPTHFGRILQYFRDSHTSLVWLENPNVSIAEIKEVQKEAKYYDLKNLFRILHWELVHRGPVVTNVVNDPSKFCALSSSESVPITHESLVSLDWSNMNFAGVKFEYICFRHPVNFNGSVLRGALFTECVFRNVVDFTDCYMVGTRFVECSGSESAEETFKCDGASGAECIPSW